MSEAVAEDVPYTAVEVAALLRTTRQHVVVLAKRHQVGYDLGGSAGFRFTELDVKALKEALRPKSAPARRRKTRRSS